MLVTTHSGPRSSHGSNLDNSHGILEGIAGSFLPSDSKYDSGVRNGSLFLFGPNGAQASIFGEAYLHPNAGLL